MPLYRIPHNGGGMFVWLQAFSLALTGSFALPLVSPHLCPPIQMQKLPPQQAGEQQVHTYSPYSSNVGLQVKPEKQLQKQGLLAVPKGCVSSVDGVETPIISTAHRRLSVCLTLSLSLTTIRCHSLSFMFPNPTSLPRVLHFFHPLCSLSPACQCSFRILSSFQASDEVICMHGLSSSTQHGRARYDLHHHSAYLQIPS